MLKPFFVRCYVKRSERQWIAMCIDLCLAAQADSSEDARARLGAQINDYVREAVTVDREHAHILLTRKAPIIHRVEYHVIAALHAILSPAKRREREQCAYEELVAVTARVPNIRH